MELLWITDPHLNFAGIAKAEALLGQANSLHPDALVVTGDIGEAHDLEGWLRLMAQQLRCPVYFVLGNHDFYGSTITQVRADVSALCQSSPHLIWLSELDEPIALHPQRLGLIGHDGWADARAGDFMGSKVWLNDFVHIQDLRSTDKLELRPKLEALGLEAAQHLEQQAIKALDRFDHVLVATHIPPFIEACWHEGQRSDDQWAPFFVCEQVGQRLLALMERHSHKRMTVLCGHTHGAGDAWILPNLHVRTGGAVYRQPALQPTLYFNCAR